MSKRKMPAHIVLPNGMWRFVKKGAKKTSKAVRSVRVRSKRKRSGVIMARRRKGAGRRSSLGGLGMGGLSLKGLLVGAGGATLADNAGITGLVPYGKYVAGAGAGKVAGTGILSGVAGVFVRDMLKGTKISAGGSLGNY